MKRVIVKIGTKALTAKGGGLDVSFLENIVAQIVELRRQDTQVVLVTSGAVGAGKSIISLDDIQSEVVQKQVFAAGGGAG